MDTAVQRLRQRGRAAPRRLKTPLLIVVFVLPLWWVVGTDTVFDLVFSRVVMIFGRDAPLIHLLSYLVCTLPLLVGVGVIV